MNEQEYNQWLKFRETCPLKYEPCHGLITLCATQEIVLEESFGGIKTEQKNIRLHHDCLMEQCHVDWRHETT